MLAAMNEPSPSDLARALGRLGGAARAANMSPEDRSAGASKAARARWKRVRRNRRRKGQAGEVAPAAAAVASSTTAAHIEATAPPDDSAHVTG